MFVEFTECMWKELLYKTEEKGTYDEEYDGSGKH